MDDRGQDELGRCRLRGQDILKSSKENWNGRNYIRPTYPFQRWTLFDTKDEESENKSLDRQSKLKYETPDGEVLYERIPARRHNDPLLYSNNIHDFNFRSSDILCCPGNFRTFLLQEVNEGDARYPICGEGTGVLAFVEDNVYKLRDFLHANFRMFRGCRILKTGSVYERTKIEKPDEFDFMIEVPALIEEESVKITLFPSEDEFASGLANCDIVNPAFFEDVCTHTLSKYDPLQDGFDRLSDLTFGLSFTSIPIVKLLLIPISRIIRNKLDQLIPEESKYRGIYLQPAVEKAMTFTLLWQGKSFPWLPISIDFVIGIPLHLIHDLDILANKPKHAVFHNHASRISFSVLEMGILRENVLDDGRNKYMRLMKLLVERYISKMWEIHKEKLQVLSNQALIPSYWLKNIIFYMYKRYQKDHESFSDSELPYRVVETLEVLQECCRSRTLYSFFVPNFNLMNTEGDGMEEKEENLDMATDDIENLLRSIESMAENPEAMRELKEECEEKYKAPSGLEDEAIFEHFIRELGRFAAHGYTKDGLKRLKACCIYINDFFKCDYNVSGEGKDIAFTVKGKQINIVEEMLKLHHKETKLRDESEY